MTKKKIENMTKEEIEKEVLIMKTNNLKTELEKYKDVLLKYAFVKMCTGATYFKELFNKELISTNDLIEGADISQKEKDKMFGDLFFRKRDESVEQSNYNHLKRLVNWAKHNLDNLPTEIKKKIIDDSISSQNLWSEQLDHYYKVSEKIKEIEDEKIQGSSDYMIFCKENSLECDCPDSLDKYKKNKE